SSDVNVSPVAGVGVSAPSYTIWQVRVCIQHRWRLEKTWRERRIVKQCPPDWESVVLRPVSFGERIEWVQLRPVFPFPCGQVAIATVGGGGQDPFRRAQEIADAHARQGHIGRQEGVLRDRRG